MEGDVAQSPKPCAVGESLFIGWELYIAISKLLERLIQSEITILAGRGHAIQVEDFGQDGGLVACLLKDAPIRINEHRTASAPGADPINIDEITLIYDGVGLTQHNFERPI